MISRKMFNKLSSLGFKVREPFYAENPDGDLRETIIVFRPLPGESLRDEDDPKYFDHITTDFDLRASSDEDLIRSLHEWYDHPDLRKNTLMAYKDGDGRRFCEKSKDTPGTDEIPSFTIAELESVFKVLLDMTVESLEKEDIPDPDDEDVEFKYDELVDWFLMNAKQYRFTADGKNAVSAFIDELNEKRKEVVDAGKDTCDDTELPTESDILSDIGEFEEFDEAHHEFFYSNGWGCTDNTDFGITLQRNKDYIVVR